MTVLASRDPRPIDSAPRDGRDLLLFIHGWGWKIGAWSRDDEMWRLDVPWDVPWSRNALYWMPMPADPK